MPSFIKDGRTIHDVEFGMVSEDLLESVCRRHRIVEANLASMGDKVNRFLVSKSGLTFITLVSRRVVLHELVGFSSDDALYYIGGLVTSDFYSRDVMQDQKGLAIARDCVSLMDDPSKLRELHSAMSDLDKFNTSTMKYGLVDREVFDHVDAVSIYGKSIVTNCGVGVFRPSFYNDAIMGSKYAQHSAYGLLKLISEMREEMNGVK